MGVAAFNRLCGGNDSECLALALYDPCSREREVGEPRWIFNERGSLVEQFGRMRRLSCEPGRVSGVEQPTATLTASGRELGRAR